MQLKIFRIHKKLIEISWPQEISDSILGEQLLVKDFLWKEYGEGIREIRMGFNTLSLKLKIEITATDCDDILEEITQLPKSVKCHSFKTWGIPVCYDPSFGKDLEKLANLHQLSIEEVIKIHSAGSYTLHFYGFLPGFMYLAGLDSRLHTPRKDLPERLIQTGTVAIGGKQTGIYPMDSPGGWYAIGRSPLQFFSTNNFKEKFPSIGDKIKFQPISVEEYKNMISKPKAGIQLIKS
ncbi:5-oxoprolinase subunit B family protein [Aquiflexum lacus]|uniref:5-oxoprolinase subunit B family protein n=1 Tax=Aquiflexum lacus TaxID=2483805 RepID=UPI001892D4A0|nr:allophanate hydrolase subunit 1 [Aquiflexum lacus]